MQEFDPRRPAAIRLGPPLTAAFAGLAAAVLGWQALHHDAPTTPVDPATLAALQKQAMTTAKLNAGLTPSISMIVKVAPGETLEAAVRRTGVGKDEAQQAVAMLGRVFDTVNIKAGLAFEAKLAKPFGIPAGRLLD